MVSGEDPVGRCCCEVGGTTSDSSRLPSPMSLGVGSYDETVASE